MLLLILETVIFKREGINDAECISERAAVLLLYRV